MFKRLFNAFRFASAPCKQQADLSSLEVDGQLSWIERAGCRYHRKRCPECEKYRGHLDTIRDLTKGMSLDDPQQLIPPAQGPSMPEDVRQRLAARLTRPGT
jgi:hypothetical protein